MIRLITAYTLSECMEVMGETASLYEKAGDKNVIFCEDRLTLIAERMLVKSTGGTFDSSVSTFARFLKADGKILGKQGSVMAVGKIIAALQREGQMRCFTSPNSIAAQAKSAYETLAQFSASCIDAEALRESAESLPACALQNKLFDLAKILERYDTFLQQSRYLDEAKYLSLLPDALSADEGLKDSNVFFLCFSSFTAQALRAVKVAAKHAKNVVGIFCAGEEEFYTNEGKNAFLRACSSVGEVFVEDRGAPLDGEAEHLRRTLFDPEYLSKAPKATDKVRIFSAQDRAAEAEYAAVQIKKCLSQKEGLRYRDIALLLPSTDEYALAVKKAFEDYKIPYFTDEKKSLKSHPLCRFLLSAFSAVADNYAPASVQALLSNYFFGDGDEYRNYLLKHANFRGGAKRPIKEGVEGYDFSKLQADRERLLSLTDGLPKKATGKGYVAAVRTLLNRIDAESKLESLCEELHDLSLKGYLQQFFPALQQVLSEAELLTGETLLKAEEFASLLQEGLDATEISLIPLKMDAVFVGDLCDSRIEKVRVLMALGLTEEVPRAQTDAAFISDSDIARLEEIRVQIDPTVRQVNARAKEAAALNLCTFTDNLYLTYPLSVGGESPAVSDILRYVQGAFRDADNQPLFVEKDYAKEDFIYLCSERLPAVRRLLFDRHRYENHRLTDREGYSSLSAALANLSLYTEKEGERGSIDGAQALFFDGEAISPTALETYFSCPFKMFAQRGLRLQERQEAELVAVDAGNFVHAVLERAVKGLKDCADEGAFCAYARKVGEEIFASPAFALDEGNAANTYLRQSLLDESVLAAGVVFRQIKNSAFDEVNVEKNIRTETVRGKVDRVDSNADYIRIVDYKTGSVEVKPVDYYVGKKLQMQLYMSALQGEKTPAGIFYFPTERAYQKEGKPVYKLQGYLNGDDEALKCGDKDITAEKKSEFFDANLGVNRSATVMSGADFIDFLAYAPMVAEKAREEIKSGYVSPNPYGEACRACKLGGVCGYNCAAQSVRAENGVSVDGIVRIVREEKEGKDAGV
ncbi:MAG: PD-(D/E)XK nuclease family protein [Clostridia bacterium]|nr:PD-(D/E)XK nuclease family protein [Clostridia bacterium]